MKVESIENIYIVCEDSDEGIDLRDKLIDVGIYCTALNGYDKWVLRIAREDLDEDNFNDLNDIIS